MKIRGEALELAFRIVLSCPCDVSHEQELSVFKYLQGMGADQVADYAPILDVFGAASTPFHRLAAFTRWVAPAEGEPVIEREHVLRLNASSYHWEHAASTLPSASRRVTSVSSWMLAHMTLPVRLELDAAGESQAVYEYVSADDVSAGDGNTGEAGGGRVVLRHVFVPPEFVATGAGGADDGLWAIHFAAVAGRLTAAEAQLMVLLLEANQQLVLHRVRVSGIDYGDFELQGDNGGFCRRRHAPFWGAGRPDALGRGRQPTA